MAKQERRSYPPLFLASIERGLDHRRHRFLVRQTLRAEEFHQLRDNRRGIVHQGWIIDLQPFDIWRGPTPAAHLFAVRPQPALELVVIETGTLSPKARCHRLLR